MLHSVAGNWKAAHLVFQICCFDLGAWVVSYRLAEPRFSPSTLVELAFFNTLWFLSWYVPFWFVTVSCLLHCEELQSSSQISAVGNWAGKGLLAFSLGCIPRDNLCCQALLYLTGSISFSSILWKPASLNSSYCYRQKERVATSSCTWELQDLIIRVYKGHYFLCVRAHTGGWLPRHAVCLLKWTE